MIEKIKFVLICIIPIIAIILIDFDNKQESIEKYNSGYCKECNTRYETFYIIDEGQKYIVYKCPHCYKMGNINANFIE